MYTIFFLKQLSISSFKNWYWFQKALIAQGQHFFSVTLLGEHQFNMPFWTIGSIQISHTKKGFNSKKKKKRRAQYWWKIVKVFMRVFFFFWLTKLRSQTPPVSNHIYINLGLFFFCPACKCQVTLILSSMEAFAYLIIQLHLLTWRIRSMSKNHC